MVIYLFPLRRKLRLGPFEVKSGGILNIRQSQQMIFTYTYDASGNRTTRQFSAMASSLEAVPVDQEED